MEQTEPNIRCSAAEIDEMLRRGGDRTNYARIDAMTEEDIAASIDREKEGEFDGSAGFSGIHGVPNHLIVRVDPHLMARFKTQGDGYNTRIHAVLRDYVEAQQRRGGSQRS